MVHAKLGGHWRLPTKADVEELINNTTVTYSPVEYEIRYNDNSTITYNTTIAVVTGKNGNYIQSFMTGFWTGTMSEQANYPYVMGFNTQHTPSILFLEPYHRDDWWQIRPVWDPNFE